MKYDFSGWATRNDLLCSDGRTIKRDAFKGQNGKKVPLVWNHDHTDPERVLGHAILENRADGVYAYCTFNNSESAQAVKERVRHGDLEALSIFANQLKQNGKDVIHGMIREVSIVLAGANPGAYIDEVMVHGEDEGGLVINYDERGINVMMHSDDDKNNPEQDDDKPQDDSKKKNPEQDDDGETIEDVFNTLTEKQKKVVYAIVGAVVDGDNNSSDNKGGADDMKHNVFENDKQDDRSVLSHADQVDILALAKSSTVGSFQEALKIYANENNLQHDALSGGFVQTGDGNISYLFPEYKEVRPGAPEIINYDQGWVTTVLGKVHKSPISRIRTSQVDIRGIDDLKAKGYVKGKEKKLTGNFKLVRRTTEPQTVYVRNAIHRDDIVDITDFDYVKYLYDIDRTMLNEALATAIMIGDEREDGVEDKIFPDKIRPIWTDDDLYTIHVDIDLNAAKKELQGSNTSLYFGDNYVHAEAMVNAILYARENYKGTGTPDLFITPHELNVMLLARDRNGRKIYASKAELASALNVGNIYTAEQFANKTRTTSDRKTKKLLGIVANLADYSLGSTKGGEITHFTQFDIDFNQEKSLLETRCSGALTRVYSAIAIEEDVTETSVVSDDEDEIGA
jgi:HK97 family phage prohead protease